ncbi:MAG: type VI secretion system Vgr family protein [Lysobacterales bacterium]
MTGPLTSRSQGLGKPFKLRLLRGIALAFLVLASFATAAPVGTTFDYQGAIARSGEPADGEFEMEFRLYSSSTSDFELATPELFSQVIISNGHFQVPLDFGALPFDGEEAWLEISLKAVGSPGPLTILSPRQPIRAIPYALHARSVQADAIGGGNVVDGSIETQDLADSAVTPVKIDASGAPADGVLSFVGGQVQWLSRQQLAASSPNARLSTFTEGLLETPEDLLNASSCLNRQGLLALLDLGGLAYTNIQAVVVDETISGANRHLVVFKATNPVNVAGLLGQTATLQITNSAGDSFFAGPVIGLDLLASSSSEFTYRVVFSAPWGLLDLNRDHQVYQDLNVPEVIEAVFDEANLDVVNEAFQSYPSTPLEMRFDETPFSFIRRLMEREGLLLVSDTTSAGSTLRLIDRNNEFGASVGRFPISPRDAVMGSARILSGFSIQSSLVQEVSTQGFGDNTPAMGLFATSDNSGQIRGDYRYESGLKTQQQVDRRQAVRLSQRDAMKTRVITRSNIPQIKAGTQFSVDDGAMPVFNGDYLAVRVQHALLKDPVRACVSYSNEIVAQPFSQPYVLPEITPMPTVPAVTSATVVGPAGESLHTDFTGRIKVQFHWDGVGALDDFSGPFIRVATSTENLVAGPTIAPIGSEVLVSFMDGDVNQPVVVGSLNNDAFRVRLEGSGYTSLIASFQVSCDGDKSTIATGFRTPPGPQASVVSGAAGFSCEFDLGFNLSLRNWIVRVNDSAVAASTSCHRSGPSELSCAAYDYSGRPIPAGLSMAFY